MIPTVTLLYGGLNALLNVSLGTAVSLLRIKEKSYVGDATPPTLLRLSRAHGNNAEWVPLGVLLLLLVELGGASSMAMHLLGGSLLLGRVLHAIGFIGKNPLSTIGATVNYVVVGLLALEAVLLHFK